VHEIIRVERRLMAACALSFAEENVLSMQFRGRSFCGIELAKQI